MIFQSAYFPIRKPHEFPPAKTPAVHYPPHIDTAGTQNSFTAFRRGIRHFLGIIFALVATIFFLSVVTLVVEPDPEITRVVVVIIAVIGLAFAAVAYRLLRKTIPVRARPCPNCGGHEIRVAGVLTRRRSFFLRHLGGFLLEALWGQSQRQQVVCTSCETPYDTETKSTRAWGVAAWVFILLLLLGAIANQYVPDK